MFYDPFAPAFSYFFFFYVVVGKLNWPNTGWHVLFIKIKILLRFWRSQRVILFISLMNNLMQLVFFFPSSIHFLLDFGRVFCCFMLLDSLKRDLSKSFLYCLLSNKVLCAFFCFTWNEWVWFKRSCRQILFSVAFNEGGEKCPCKKNYGEEEK